MGKAVHHKKRPAKPRPVESDHEDDEELEEEEEVMGLDLSDEEEEDENDLSDADDEVTVKKPSLKDLDEKAWGRKRSAFYDADDSDEDEQAAKDQEEEALRLQQKKLSAMTDADFADESVLMPEDSLGSLAKKKTKATPAKKSSQKSSVEVEQIERDFSQYTESELMSLVKKDSPELLDLLNDFKAKITEIKEHIKPMLERVQTNQLPTNKGISFLDVKYQLLLSYCMNLAFYFHLKVSGQSVKDHPVVMQLVELRAYIEKLRPLETKFKYQIDKMVKMANTGKAASVDTSDPLAFRPNPSALTDEEEEEQPAQKTTGEIYRPAKIAPVRMDEKTRKIDRLKKKPGMSKVLQELQDEFSDKPEEVVDRTDVIDEEEAERTRFEEENFVRLAVSKKDKKKKKDRTGTNLINELEELQDFGDLGALEEEEKDPFEELRKRKRRDEMPSKSAMDDVDFGGMDDDDFMGGMDDLDDSYYEEVKASKKKKTAQREAAREQASKPFFPSDEADGKRSASESILRNRGLTPKRNKEFKNPRVKRRVRYEEAKKKLVSTGARKATSEKSRYGGELTGIKSNLSRSVRIK